MRMLRLLTALVLLGVIARALADTPPPSGRQIFEKRCQTCHGTIGRADSGTVWSRDSLRRFLSGPQTEIPGTYMPARVVDPAELESLLDFVESLR